MRAARDRAYKEITYQQLRSFCQTARLGSYTAAAHALGLANPTVWTQVHSLERELGEKLVEQCGHRCHLTEAGRVLLELAAPPVAGIATLRHGFRQARAQVPMHLVVGAMPRIVSEDFPECVEAFMRQQPNVCLALREFMHEEIREAIAAGEIDLAFTVDATLPASADGRADPRLEWEVCYHLGVFLVTPRSHPLARCRRVQPRDLCAYPLVNARDALRDRAVSARMEEFGLFRTGASRLEARSVAAIRAYVQQGFGIGLVCCLPPRRQRPFLHERNLSHLFGQSPIYLLRRKGVPLSPGARAFVETVKARLGNRRKRSSRS